MTAFARMGAQMDRHRRAKAAKAAAAKQTADPRNPKEVLTQEGIEPNPGPHRPKSCKTYGRRLWKYFWIFAQLGNFMRIEAHGCNGVSSKRALCEAQQNTLAPFAQGETLDCSVECLASVGVKCEKEKKLGDKSLIFFCFSLVICGLIFIACFCNANNYDLRTDYLNVHIKKANRKVIIRARQTGGRQPRRFHIRLRKAQRLRRNKHCTREERCQHEHCNVDSLTQPTENEQSERKQIDKTIRKVLGRRRARAMKPWILANAMCQAQAVLTSNDSIETCHTRHSCNLLNTINGKSVNTSSESKQNCTCESTQGDNRSQSKETCEEDKRPLSIITANVHALRPRAENTTTWDTDVLLVQETKLAPHAVGEVTRIIKEDGWDMVHGKPCKTQNPRSNTNRTHAATEATSGGVAILTRMPKKPLVPNYEIYSPILHDTGRWVEAKIPISGNARFLTIASFYGISGANSDGRKKALNDNIITQAIEKVIEAGNDPYILAGDFNIEPETSIAIAAAVDEGLLVDVGHEWATKTKEGDDPEDTHKLPEPTYSNSDPEPGMTGPGVTRIDLVLANPTAAAAIQGHYPRWDLIVEKHVPQEIHMDMDLLAAPEVIQKTRGNVIVHKTDEEEWPFEITEAYTEARQMYERELEEALEDEQVDKAHIVWNKITEAALMTAQGMSLDEAKNKIESTPLRGDPPMFTKRMKTKPKDKIGNPVVHKQREINNLRNKLRDVRARFRRLRKRCASGVCNCDAKASSSAFCGASQNARATDKEGKVEDISCQDHNVLTSSTSEDIFQNTATFALYYWSEIEHKFKTLLGDEAFTSICPDTEPTDERLAQLIQKCTDEFSEIATRRGLDRRQENRKRAKWDWEMEYGKRAYRNSRTNYRPPTTTIQDPDDPGNYIADKEKIHEQFLKAWEKVYRVHPENANIWDNFHRDYGKYIPRADFQDFRYEADDFIMQLNNMKSTSAGFDGWTRDALKALPRCAWVDRARIENLAKDKGILPEAYLHVMNPMLPKGQALRPEHHRAITIFSMVHRVVYGALWQKLKLWQELWIGETQHGGRVGGEYLADAWDRQANIEAAQAEGTDLVGAFLDYEKFFDRFHPSLVRGLLEKSGLPPGIASQLHFLYTNLQRYIRVVDTYGAVIPQTNGIGQGCSLSLIVANLYVATLFNLLTATFPEVDLGAFLDDRNITTTSTERMVQVLEATKQFDNTAGHKTNLSKSYVFANTQSTRDQLRKHNVMGKNTKITTAANMVGHDITAKRMRDSKATTERTGNATNRARKVTNMMDQTRSQRAKLITNAVILAAISGTMWTIPSKRATNALKTEILRAIWGKGR